MIHLAVFCIGASLSALLTYLVHSTAWISGALLLARFNRALSPAARHVVWRAALIGPLASSAFVLGLGHRWEWALTPETPEEAWAAVAAAVPPSAAAAMGSLPLADQEQLVRDGPSQGAPLAEIATPLPWVALLISCWAAVALIGLLLIARAALRQRRAFAARSRVTEAACREALELLLKHTGIRHHVWLSRCAAASTPLVLSAREICLPERAMELDQDAFEAVLAHELAHIERRDGFWLNCALVLQALFWFQPLNRKARAKLQESAELAADDRAVQLTGDALGLARTLTQVASWASHAAPAPALAMARAGSPIVDRVARLVEARDAGSPANFESRTPWFALAALAAIGACTPSVGCAAPTRRAARPPSNLETPAPSTTRLVPVVASNPALLMDASRLPPAPPAEDMRGGAGPRAGNPTPEALS